MVTADRSDLLRRIAARIPGAMGAGRAMRRLIAPDLRAIGKLRREQPGALFQPFPTTFEDRYPELFDALAARLAHIERPRVLSFGCADGAEARSLRRWLPKAEITGIDINPRAIAEARRRLALDPDPAIRFELAADVAGEPAESYDAVLALAVFRHGELERDRPENCAAIMPFARFAGGVAMLDRIVKPGGWLVIWNSHFRLADTPLAPAYAAQTLPWSESAPMVLHYGPDDRRSEQAYAEVLFRKDG
jgi:SAM-dependent methyltransferase